MVRAGDDGRGGLPRRPSDAHKNSNGRVLVVAASRAMPGAAALAVEAAYRGGCGYVLAACPGAAVPALVQAAPNAVLRPVGDASREHFQAEDARALLAAAADADAVVLGPGWGQGVGADWFPAWLRDAQADAANGEGTGAAGESTPRAFVIDADALNALAAAGSSALKACGPRCVLTPHPGEAARLLGWDGAAQVQADRPAALAALTAATEAVVVLKGAGTLVGARDGVPSADDGAAGDGSPPWRDETGGPELATAGTGDVLAGLLGALLARGLAPSEAARTAVTLHARAGARAATELGAESVVAQDLLPRLGPLLEDLLAPAPESPSARDAEEADR